MGRKPRVDRSPEEKWQVVSLILIVASQRPLSDSARGIGGTNPSRITARPNRLLDGSASDPDVLRKGALYAILDRLGIPRKKGAQAFTHSGIQLRVSLTSRRET